MPERSALPGGRAARMRLFVALDLPPRVSETLIGWQRSVLEGRPALRGVSAAGMHVTLCFLGSRPASELPAIEAAFLAASASPDGDAVIRSPALALGDALWLPVRRPRVLAIALHDPGNALAHVQASLARRLAGACDYEPDQREFRPHVTIARVRRRARVALEPLEPPPALTFDATRIALYRSYLATAGARYEPLLTVELG
ncbi:MAG: RNA 2',3'-cyclic phosphodiesterase [Solirubrobacteraceae bacterium]